MAATNLRFADKVAIVTGGCSGIGKACADVFVEQGGKVAVLDFNEAEGNTINAAKSNCLVFIRCDVTKDDDVMKAVDATIKRFGKLDCLVNCAGIVTVCNIDQDDVIEDMQRMFDVHVLGSCRMAKHALPHIRKTKGSVVNMASIVVPIGVKNALSYVTAKGAVYTMTKAMALDEVKHGVRVNSISPSYIDTQLINSYYKNKSERPNLESNVQMNRFGTPREVALTCLYLAVDATYSTGSDILMSGGTELGFGVKV